MEPSVIDCGTSSLDLQDLVDRCLGNIALVERVVAKFEVGFHRDLVELEEALSNRDSAALATVAHRLKGASANVSAQRMHQTAAQVERLSREGRLAEVPEAVEALHLEGSRFTAAIASLSGDLPKVSAERPHEQGRDGRA